MTIGGAIASQPLVPGFILMGDLRACASGLEWVAVRTVDGQRFSLKVIPVTDAARARSVALEQMAVQDRIENDHLVRRRDAIALADGTLALVLEEVTGGSLAQLLSARGKLTAGETVTIVTPLFRALGDLHAVGVVHGALAPGNVLFSADGRPMVDDLGVACLMAAEAAHPETPGSFGFMGPELLSGAAPSPASDVYAIAALGWFCLTGAGPTPAVVRTTVTALPQEEPGTSERLLEFLARCLVADPAARPSASEAAVEAFDSAPAESVALVPVADPAAEITRRIRAAAATPEPAAPRSPRRWRTWRVPGWPTWRQQGRRTRRPLGWRAPMAGALVLVVVVVFGAGAIWLVRRPAASLPPAAVPAATGSPARGDARTVVPPVAFAPNVPPVTRPSMPLAAIPRRSPATVVPRQQSEGAREVVMASASPRVAPAALLQGLVDARALAYVARRAALLDLVYAPGADKAAVDRRNIATALSNGGTYIGLSFVIKDAGYLQGTATTARVRATILTPAYSTGQPDGRRIPHAREVLGPAIFTLSLTPDGWRILALTVA